MTANDNDEGWDIMRQMILWLLGLALFFCQPALAQDTTQPILSVPQHWPIAGARWHPNGHDFWTWGREFSPTADGNATYQDYLRPWDGTNGSLIHELSYHGDNVAMNLDWSAGDDRLLVYSGNSVEVWDALNGTKTWVYPYSARISGAHWDAAFKRILFWSYDDGSIHIWNTDTFKEIFLAQTDKPSDLVDVKWSPDEKTVAAVLTQSPGSVQIWDVTTAQKQQTFDYSGMVYSADWSADSKNLLIIGDKVVQLVNVATKNVLHERKDDLFLYRAEWSADHKRVAVRSENEPIVEVWDATSGSVISTLRQSGHLDNVIWETQWSKDNQHLLTHSPDGIGVWDVTTGELTFWLAIEVRGGSNMSWYSWSPDETKLIYMRSDGSVRIVNLTSNAEIMGELSSPIALSLPAPNFVWNSDSSQVMLSGGDNTARVWDTASGKLLALFQHPSHEGFSPTWVTNALWRPDGQTILTLGTPDYCGGADACPTEAMLWRAPH